ncbi:MAG: UDP-3-O-(3-hydroxymyristoyl)glucosamine N-acyltransferase [Planctomycetes bacterium]|nr:UDP-3-O-(3-hydroxymyristoyl)glucosamine N-acyltransferase [Planctomycetota bacterium]
MELALDELAARIGARLEGDPTVTVRGVAPIELATPSDLVLAENEERVREALRSPAAALLVGEKAASGPRPLLRCGVPRAAFGRALALFHPERRPEPGVHPTAVVGAGVELGRDVAIGPHAVLGAGCRVGDRTWVGPNCVIGDGSRLGADCRLHPNVTVYERVSLGDRVILHAGCVLGADGYGYAFEAGRHVKIPQVGRVEIGDDVEIGANTTIDRATLGTTRIGRGTKIDNLVQVAHNVEVGEGCLLVAQAGISGSSRLGNFVTLAGQVGIGDHVRIEDGAIVAGQAGVASGKRLGAGQLVWGTPARPLADIKRREGALARLPRVLEQVRDLVRRVKRLEGHHE